MKMRRWICERKGRYAATGLIWAESRKQAQAKLDTGTRIDDINVDYYSIGPDRVIRDDKVRKKK